MQLIKEVYPVKPVVKLCLECKKDVNTGVHNCRSFKGKLLHIRCADNLFSTLFFVSYLGNAQKLKNRFHKDVKFNKCLICYTFCSKANGFKHSIVYEGHLIHLKIHRTCFFERYGMTYHKKIEQPKSLEFR